MLNYYSAMNFDLTFPIIFCVLSDSFNVCEENIDYIAFRTFRQSVLINAAL